MKKVMKRLFLAVPLLLLFGGLLLGLSLHFTPKPLFALLNSVPLEAQLTKPAHYGTIANRTTVKKDISYSSDYPASTLDLYLPDQITEPLPVVLFVHGGGFFKGDKEMAKYFGPTIASEQYAFVSLNYDLVPAATVFDQVKYVNAAVKFIAEEGANYSLKTDQLTLAGSSAGGFLALQLLSSYYDAPYAEKLGVTPVPGMTFDSLLLYSAVYDLSAFQEYQGNFASSYLLSKLGWGLTGVKNWQQDQALGELLDLTRYVHKDFPPVFLTDGNTRTFTKQAQDYARRLKAAEVPVETLFFDSETVVGHGYQLQMDTPPAKSALQKTLAFLERTTKTTPSQK